MTSNSIKAIVIFAFSSLIFAGCDEWTETEKISFYDPDMNVSNKTDEYYAALREWKSTPGLPQTFVWFDNWNGVSPTGENSLRGLPDSVTIAANWGGHPKFDLSPERRADMEYVQRVKGTKVVVTLFSSNIGDDIVDWDEPDVGDSSDESVVRPLIRKYAEALYDAVIENGYDGYDWDYEPHGMPGNFYLWTNKLQRRIFVEELSYWFGLGSQRTDRGGRKPAKPGLLLIIDGEVGIQGRMGQDWDSHYFNYYVLQAYASTTDKDRTRRVKGVIDDMYTNIEEGRITADEVVRRTILTENFESYAGTGGGFLGMSQFIYDPNGMNQQIGGCGMYRVGFDYNQGKGDYNGSPEYYFLRQGITNLYRIYNERKNAPEPQPEP